MNAQEWIKRLNEFYSFPCKVAFILIKESNGVTGIYSTSIKSTSKIENIKYSQISKDTWTSEASAILSVKEIEDASEFLKEKKRLEEIWGFAIIKKETIES